LQYGKRVWNLEGNPDQLAKEAIVQTESFFHRLDIQTKISDYTTDHEHVAEIIKERFRQRGWVAMGEKQAIQLDDVEAIVNNAIL
jgi:NADP-dependent alcohol dehydrogenase